jgi:hypothetical protein
MNDLPRHTLSRIIAEHGRGICDAPKRVEALLRDLCGAHRREINIIAGALEERVAEDLIATGNSVPRDVLLARLAARLRDNLAYTPEAARWGVETWAAALGILSEAELQERAQAEQADAIRSIEPPPVRNPKPSAANPSINPQASQPQRGTTRAPTQQPSPKSKTNPQPIVRPPARATHASPQMLPNVAVPEPLARNVSPLLASRQTSRRGLTLRGCFILVVLAIVLIVAAVFVVPAVIMILREEQSQPGMSEPRIR